MIVAPLGAGVGIGLALGLIMLVCCRAYAYVATFACAALVAVAPSGLATYLLVSDVAASKVPYALFAASLVLAIACVIGRRQLHLTARLFEHGAGR
jgi:hypothetical protein